MTDLQARLLFAFLADLSIVRSTEPIRGRRLMENIAAGSGVTYGEVRDILNRFDSATDERAPVDTSAWTDDEILANAADIARKVTGDDFDMDPIGIIAPRSGQ